ncbi:hypothetical protein C1X54_35370, partial [Pseudomonas sp. GW460-13]
MARRGAADPYAAPMSVYEIHALSWLQAANDPQRGWDILAERLAPYVQELGFTHIELLPEMVARAFRIAREGRPGPAYLEIPSDVMFARINDDALSYP